MDQYSGCQAAVRNGQYRDCRPDRLQYQGQRLPAGCVGRFREGDCPGSSGSALTKTTTRLRSKRSSMKALKPIRSEADYDAALAELEHLWGARAGTPGGDRLDILATLVDAYENEHYPMDPPDPIEAIKFRMEQQGLTRKDLEGVLGTRTRVAEVLNRRRSLSIHMIRRLHETLGISAEVLIRPSRIDRAA